MTSARVLCVDDDLQVRTLIERAYAGTLSRLSAVEYRDGATGTHLERVGADAGQIAHELGSPEERTELLRLAAPLHDIGKIAVPDSILQQAGSLTSEERRLMEQHAEVERDLLGGSTTDRPYRPALSAGAAVAHVLSRRSIDFDPNVVDAFVNSLEPEGAAA